MGIDIIYKGKLAISDNDVKVHISENECNNSFNNAINSDKIIFDTKVNSFDSPSFLNSNQQVLVKQKITIW